MNELHEDGTKRQRKKMQNITQELEYMIQKTRNKLNKQERMM